MKVFLISLILSSNFFLQSGAALSKDWMLDNRIYNPEGNIQEALRAGELSEGQAAKFKAGEMSICVDENSRRARHGGNLTVGDQIALEKKVCDLINQIAAAKETKYSGFAMGANSFGNSRGLTHHHISESNNWSMLSFPATR